MNNILSLIQKECINNSNGYNLTIKSLVSILDSLYNNKCINLDIINNIPQEYYNTILIDIAHYYNKLVCRQNSNDYKTINRFSENIHIDGFNSNNNNNNNSEENISLFVTEDTNKYAYEYGDIGEDKTEDDCKGNDNNENEDIVIKYQKSILEILNNNYPNIISGKGLVSKLINNKGDYKIPNEHTTDEYQLVRYKFWSKAISILLKNKLITIVKPNDNSAPYYTICSP